MPGQLEEQEASKLGLYDADKPNPKDLVGNRVQGVMKSNFQVVKKQSWGFVASDAFAGQMFFHLTENPDMNHIEFDREDFIEFDIALDDKRTGVRARNMTLVCRVGKPPPMPVPVDKKLLKRKAWN